MIRNYNGNVNRTILRDLERLCDVNSENGKKLMEAFAKNGEVYFFVMSDEFSEVRILKSEAEIKEYLKGDFLKRLAHYLEDKDTDDYLLRSLIEFIKENAGTFPDKDEMRRLERTAEAKRVDDISSPKAEFMLKVISVEKALSEILQLSEKIIESRRKNNPKDICNLVEGCRDVLVISNKELSGSIIQTRRSAYGDFRDYSCVIMFDNYNELVNIKYDYTGKPVICAKKQSDDRVIDVSILKHIIPIHKAIVKWAQKEDIKFETAIDYQKIS